MSKLNAHSRSLLFPINFSNFHLSKSPPPRHKSLFSGLASNAASKTPNLASKTSNQAHWSSNGKRKLEKIATCGIIGHWPFRARCSSHHLILPYTNIGASGTADHATFFSSSSSPSSAKTYWDSLRPAHKRRCPLPQNQEACSWHGESGCQRQSISLSLFFFFSSQ